MSESQFTSLLPGDAIESGFLDGVTATILSARAVMHQYQNRPDLEPFPAIAVTFAPLEGGKESVQHYKVGKGEHRVPSDDGLRFKHFGKGGLPKGSNGFAFVLSMINAGFPQDKISDDLSVFDNAVVKLRSEAVPKQNEGDKDRSIVLVEKVETLPWDNKGAAKGAKKTTATAAPKAAAGATVANISPMSDEAAKEAAQQAVVAILSEKKNQGGVAKKDIGTLAFKALSQSPNRNNAVKLLSTQASEFLPTIAGALVQAGEEIIGTVGYENDKLFLVAA